MSKAWDVLVLVVLVLPAVVLVDAPGAQGAPGSCAIPGPDAGSYACDLAAYDWRDASQGTALTLRDDDASGAISVPFTFPWHGTDNDFVYVGSNGVLCFDRAGCSSLTPQQMPDTASPNGVVACFWHDLDPSRPGASVRYATFGSSPDRVFVVEWAGVPFYGGQGSNTFQAQLREDGEARCMWKSVDREAGKPTAVGAESPDGSTGVRYAYTDFTAAQQGVRFFHCACTAPGAPQSLAAQRGPGVGQVTLTWSAPASDGGAAIRGYDVLRSSSAGQEALLGSLGDVRTFADSGLPAGSTWFYTVRARNLVGAGQPSAEAEGKAPGVPGLPALTAQPGPNAGQITLRWNLPDDGGLAVRFFRLWRSTCSGCEGNFANVGPGTTQFVDSVSCCPRWFYQVNAVNDQGDGPRSNEASSLVPLPPGAPRSLAGDPGPDAGQVSFRWAPPADDGGLPVSGYRVYRSFGAGFNLLIDQAALRFTDSGLTAGSFVTYKVSARNGAGEGPTTATITLRVPTKPSVPLGLDARAGNDLGSIALRWQAPADDGGLPITGYRVYRGDGSGNDALVATLGNVTSYADRDAGVLAVQYYRVAALNRVGEGPRSSAVCAAPNPWGVVDPVTGTPCPLPAGWVERVLVDQTVALGGRQPLTPAVDANVLTVDGRPWALNANYYVVQVTAGGVPAPPIRIYTSGLLTGPVHQSFVHEPAHDAQVPVSKAHVVVRERHDPASSVCLVAIGETCGANAPDPHTDPATWGRAAILVRVDLQGADGAVAASPMLVIPFAGTVVPDTA